MPAARIRSRLVGHDVLTVPQAGFGGIKNGELLKRIEEGRFDAFITVDKNLPSEQRVRHLPFGILVVRAKSNRLQDVRPLARKILEGLAGLKAGHVAIVGRRWR